MNEKKLLVLSDTHGGITQLTYVFNWAKERLPPDDTITTSAFLGDGISDLTRAAEITGYYSDWKLVRGNNDYGYSVPEAAYFDFQGYRFYMSHGHRMNIYGGYHTLAAAAKNIEAEVVLFGHAHVPICEKFGNLLFINPGSVSSPRSRKGPTFAVLECIENEVIKPEFYGIGARGKISPITI